MGTTVQEQHGALNGHSFYRGILAALQVVALHDQETVYREIVNAVDEDDLIAVAMDDPDQLEMFGLVKYGYVE